MIWFFMPHDFRHAPPHPYKMSAIHNIFYTWGGEDQREAED